MDLIEEIFRNTRTIAVIGMKDDRSDAYTVPEYLHKNGFIIYPVNPTREGKEALGKKFLTEWMKLPMKSTLLRYSGNRNLFRGM